MILSIPIRVVVVDDHDMLRSSLEIFFEVCEDLLLVGQAKNGEEAVALCEQLQPDVVIVDLRFPEIDGIATTHLIREKCPDTRIIMLTYSSTQADIQAALEAGVSRYLLKDMGIDELADAIRAAGREK